MALGYSNFVYFYSYHCENHRAKWCSWIDRSGEQSNGRGSRGCDQRSAYDTLMGCQYKTGCSSQDRFEEGVKPYLGMIDGLTRMCTGKGFWGMWKSVVPNLILVSNPTIHFFVYERVRIIIADRETSRLCFDFLEFFLMGAIAKTVATFLTSLPGCSISITKRCQE